MKGNSNIRYTKTKKNILGKTKTKEISEKKYEKLSSRYAKRGGETYNVKYPPAMMPNQSSNMVVGTAKNKRGTKSVAKTMYK